MDAFTTLLLLVSVSLFFVTLFYVGCYSKETANHERTYRYYLNEVEERTKLENKVNRLNERIAELEGQLANVRDAMTAAMRVVAASRSADGDKSCT